MHVYIDPLLLRVFCTAVHEVMTCIACHDTGPRRSAVVAQTAATLAELLMSHSRMVPMVMTELGESPPPLPKAAAGIQLPLVSLLPLVELDIEESASVRLQDLACFSTLPSTCHLQPINFA